jgi:hypothetical protein
METKTTFERLYPLDVSQQTKELQRQTYLPWPKAWAGIKKECPDATYKTLCDDNGLPFFESPMGIFVKTEVTINGETLPMWRPVLNGANKAMKSVRYSYHVAEYINKKKTGNTIEKWVEPATSTDINEAIMRCLVKNFAMFGYGLHVFKGERSPEVETLDSHQLSEITAYASEHKINLMDLAKVFGVQRVPEIHAYNFDNAIQWLNDAVGTDKN